MKKLWFGTILAIGLLSGCSKQAHQSDFEIVKNGLRAPAYPLITVDPYTSGWSFTDNLYDSSVKHWTGKDFPLIGVAKVDGKTFRFMGKEEVELVPIVKTADLAAWSGKYTTQKPGEQWTSQDFNDSSWKEGTAPFGTFENEPTAKTNWTTDYIWVRRSVNIDEDLTGKKIYLEFSHDDDAIIYINGIEAVNTGNSALKNVSIQLPQKAASSLKKGENIITAYCYNRAGNAFLDFGLSYEKPNSDILENAAIQKSVDVQATQTHYTFTCGDVDLKLSFSAPLFMDNLELVSRPINYITYNVTSNDGKSHDVDLYFEASSHWALDKPIQEAISEESQSNGLILVRTGSKDQNILAKQGDDLRIDWGYFYMAAEKENTTFSIGNSTTLRSGFVNGDKNLPQAKVEGVNNKIALTRSLGSVNNSSGKIMIGYDDIYSVQYFGENLRPYWNTNGDQTIEGQFDKANKEYDKLIEQCYKFDKDLMLEAEKSGGKKYAELCALAYRQAITAHKLAKAPNGDLLFLSKENFSNGSIGTVDVTYPSAPLFLIYNTELAKGLMNHIYYYSESGRWKKPFPAHDIGTYPLANGQTYGDDMPVEEAGNMLTLTAAVTAVDGNADYAKKHWEVLTIWADYLAANGLDPDNQLCTDDFAGHFAHNANLSVKAIMGVASYGYMADKLGDKETGKKYTDKAKEMAQQWMKMADDGDHYRLTFDQPGTWSQKYNLVWDKILKFNIFPQEVIEKEISYYLTKQNKYGLPLDNRATYTKADWIIWTATLAKDRETFEKFIDPLYLFMNETTDRIPMSDWIFTDQPIHRGFRARSVVGGYYIKMLDNQLNYNK